MVFEDRLQVFLRVTLVFASVNAFADVLDVVFNEDLGEVFVAFDGNCACELVLLVVERVTTAILGVLERRKWSRKQQVGCRGRNCRGGQGARAASFGRLCSISSSRQPTEMETPSLDHSS